VVYQQKGVQPRRNLPEEHADAENESHQIAIEEIHMMIIKYNINISLLIREIRGFCCCQGDRVILPTCEKKNKKNFHKKRENYNSTFCDVMQRREQ